MDETNTTPNLVSLTEYAREHGIHSQYVYRWINAANIEPKQASFRNRIPTALYDRAEVDAARREAENIGAKRDEYRQKKEAEGYYTIVRAAEELGVNINTLAGLVANSPLTPNGYAVNPGKRNGKAAGLYRLTDLAQLVTAKKEEQERKSAPSRTRLVSDLARMVDTYGADAIVSALAFLEGKV